MKKIKLKIYDCGTFIKNLKMEINEQTTYKEFMEFIWTKTYNYFIDRNGKEISNLDNFIYYLNLHKDKKEIRIWNPNVNLLKLLNYIENNTDMPIKIDIVYGWGAAYDEIKKPYIKFDFFPNENTGHNRPHVHVTYDKKNSVYSIDNKIEKIKGKPYNGKIDKLIINYIKENQKKMMKEWNDFTNGIRIEGDCTLGEIDIDKIEKIHN